MLITNLIQTEIELFKIIIDAPKFSKEELVLYIDEHFKSFLEDPNLEIADLNKTILFGILLRGFRIKSIKSSITEKELNYVYKHVFGKDYVPFSIFYNFYLLNTNKITIEDFNNTLFKYIKGINDNMLSNTLIIYTAIKINYNRLENTTSQSELDSIKQMSIFMEHLNKNSSSVKKLDEYISKNEIPKYII